MNIQPLSAGDKFQLSEDYVKSWSNYRGDVTTQTYPRGLVFTLVNYTSHYQKTKLRLKTIVANPIIKECYEGIDDKLYMSTSTYRSKTSKSPKTLVLSGKAQIIDFFKKVQSFDEEYLRITGQYYRTYNESGKIL
jgi:hypothetical protein